MTLLRTTYLTLGLGLFGLSSVASAQVADLKDADVKKKATASTSSTAPDGWKVKMKVGFIGNVGDTNANAASAGAGQEGTAVQFGLTLSAEANLKAGHHGLENKFGVQHAQTKTPSLDGFVKTQDNLELMSTYVYRLDNPKWLGPFARVKLQTQAFKGYAVRDVPYTVDRTNRDGTVVATETVPAQSKISLTGAFEPIVMRESAGAFARPFTGDDFKLDGKLGLGSQQIIVREGFVVTADDAAMTNLALRQLDNVTEVGAELELLLEGILVKDRLSWKFGANFFLPVITTADKADATGKANGFDYLNTDIKAGVSLKLSKWASVDYNLTVRKVPLVVDGFQVVHGLIFSAGFDIL